MDTDLKIGQEVSLEELKKKGWEDYGETRRNRRMLVKKDQGVTTGILVNPNNRIFLIKKL